MLFVVSLQQLAAQDGLQGRVTILEVRQSNLVSFSRESLEHCSRDLATKHQKLIMKRYLSRGSRIVQFIILQTITQLDNKLIYSEPLQHCENFSSFWLGLFRIFLLDFAIFIMNTIFADNKIIEQSWSVQQASLRNIPLAPQFPLRMSCSPAKAPNAKKFFFPTRNQSSKPTDNSSKV